MILLPPASIRPSRSARGTGRFFRECVADRSYRPDKVRATRGSEGVPEAADMNVDGPGAEMNVTRPSCHLKLAAGMDSPGISHEMSQQTKLGWSKVNGLTLAPHDVGGQVNLEVMECQNLRGRRTALRAGQRGQHARDELLRQKGPGNALISAGSNKLLAMAFIARRQKHQYRERSCLPFEAELRAQRSHLDARKPGLHQQDVRLEVAQPFAQSLSAHFPDNPHADLLEDVDDKSPEAVVLQSQ